MRNVARSGSSMTAVSRLARTAATFALSPYALTETAACAFVQYADSFAFETNAAINSRSPTDHAEGPRIASCIICCIAAP